jgi:tRNA (cmo5U34)-methyltransferase
MSVASHLGFSPAAYDQRIRGLIPHYDELILETAAALAVAERPVRRIVDLGIGTGTLSRACLEAQPRARVVGIEIDPSMAAMARQRLGPLRTRVVIRTGSFVLAALPDCDAMVATYALHHIRSRRVKASFYRRCFDAVRPGGIFVSGDCFPPSSPAAYARDVDNWITHLSRTIGSRELARAEFEAWAAEDTYVPLLDEVRLLSRAGFRVDVAWRRSPFAVIVGIKLAAGASVQRRSSLK